jgi:hypothetical protein
MKAASRFRTCSILAVLLISSAACKQSAGTFVMLTFDGSIPEGKPIRSIAVSLQLGTRTDSTVFSAPAGGVIVLPTDATLQIDSGDGDLTVAASALADDQSPLATGTGNGRVTTGQTTRITVHFGSSSSDGGPTDGQQDSQVGGKDATVDTPTPLADASEQDRFLAPSDSTDQGLIGTDAGGLGGTGGTGSGGAGGTANSGGGGSATGGAGGTVIGGAGGTATGGSNGTFQLRMSAPGLDFGAVPVGSVSAVQTLTITNFGTGTSPALVIFVNDGHHFPVYQDRCSGAMLRPGDTCTLAFTFNPDATGGVQTDGSVGPAKGPAATFTLSGTGSNGVATLNLSPSTVDFKAVDVGLSSALSFTVTNNGTADSGAIKIQANPTAAFQISNDRCSTTTLGKLGQCTFLLVFAPQALGPVSATITAQTITGIVATSTATGVGQDHVQLTVQFAGAGGGTVSGNNLNCQSGTACSIGIVRTDPSAFPRLDLSALANSSSLFSGWSGACTGTGNCTVIMDAAKTVTATFDPISVQISLNVIGLGGHQGTLVSDDGTITCGSSCPGLTHAASASFTLVAKPGASSTFVGWTEGPCHGTSPKCTFALSGPTTITATFGPQSYMFVSSSSIVPGQLGGVAGADNECQRLAGKAYLPGTYKAWISTTGSNAKTRVGSGGWVRTDGRPFARNLATLAILGGQTVYYPPRIDEMGNDLGNVHSFVATGGNANGTAFDSQCSDYTSVSGDIYVGDAAMGSNYWAMRQLDPGGCGSSRRLYCFRTDGPVADIVPPPQPGRHVFVSAQPFVPGGNLSADHMCQAEAAAASLANASQFVAFLSTSNTPAMQRIRPGGMPWKRADDVFVVRQISDFANGKLIATPGLVANGSLYVTTQIWTGASNPTVVGSGTCQDWTANSATLSGLIGDGATTAAPDWFSIGGITVPCNNPNLHIICIEP